MIVIAGSNAYTLAHEHKNGWNADAFKERYSDVLDRYDYIVGDWGYSQLRLRGFYQDGNPRATKESAIASLMDYLNEYCNFGCAYFVLSKADAKSLPAGEPELMPATGLEPGAELAAQGDSDAQTAETAAAAAGSNGILMRWPLKERPGGPVRVPGAAAMARAAQEAERRSQQTAAQSGGRPGGDGRPPQSGRQGAESGAYGGRQGSRSPGAGAGSDKRSFGSSNAGQAEGRPAARQGQSGARGARPSGSDRQGGGAPSKAGGQWSQPAESGRTADGTNGGGADTGGVMQDGVKNGNRWPGKNRRRNRFDGKPNRPDGSPQGGGSPGGPGGE